MTSPYTHGYTGQYGANEPPREPGSRRRKLAAMAGSVYRAGVAAASEIREQYSQTRLTRDMGDGSPEQVHIPGAFPEVPIIHRGEEQLILFPSYAKRHVKGALLPRRPTEPGGDGYGRPNGGGNGIGPGVDERDYWTAEWTRHEDEKAVVDVDIRGWIYMPPKGPMSRKNRMVLGVARRLSGLPQAAAPQAGSQQPHDLRRVVSDLEAMTEEEKIAKEAREIEKRGQGEKEAATRGEYSERPRPDDLDDGFGGMRRRRSPSPPSPTAPARTNSGLGAFPSDMTEAELAAANANLNARLAPFMATPLVGLPITLFFYNDQRSISKTIETNASGHFIARVPLDFVPTHFRVLANEGISTTQPVEVIEPRGVSLISDVDDTIKRSNINGGAREIFRNTFVRELGDQTIDGVKELYTSLHKMGVKLHYVSNSPWQLYPVLATFFHKAGLPPGSIDLKQYSGMLQGIFEPVAERKKGTLERILRDFPERKFLLVGDSGEADLEVYTDLVMAYPGRILAVFIRDVTTPEQVDMGYFTSNMQAIEKNGGLERSDSGRRRAATTGTARSQPTPPPRLPPRSSPQPRGPVMGDLIDLSDDPPQQQPRQDPRTSSLNAMHASKSTSDLPQRKGPPPRPAKPTALRSSPADIGTGGAAPPPLPPKPRESPRPSTSHQNSSTSASASGSSRGPAPPPPPPRRTNTANLSSPQDKQPPNPPPRRVQTTNSSNYDSDDGTTDEWGLPLEKHSLGNRSNTFLPVRPATSYDTMNGLNGASVYATGNTASGNGGANSPVNKKLEIWLRRLAEAHEVLERQGVKLYTWREGRDVVAEAEGIVREAMRKVV
ncbi:hypothetical protein B0T20DRAFT_66080 [Sordaria brevicollis]|uniref:Phosphatidate phosphatase APP1 catalytic domain-containing protein n=1 Tax=Sordaria brevicollis TaxID=83679 RepID=A0AAE0U644_SORBR|nr:hypothetical protein B0T20DRAFT_66080 [Sordaria brevicollis]